MLYVVNSRLDALSLRQSEDAFRDLAQSDEDVTFDMGGLEHIDSSGVGALVFVLKRLRRRGRSVRVINLSGQPKQYLRDLRLSEVFEH
jgi:anti-anti-sigma factor